MTRGFHLVAAGLIVAVAALFFVTRATSDFPASPGKEFFSTPEKGLATAACPKTVAGNRAPMMGQSVPEAARNHGDPEDVTAEPMAMERSDLGAIRTQSADAKVASGPYRLGPHGEPTPSRVVSLSPAISELLIALDASDRLVGVTRFCDDPALSEVARIGGFLDPSIEAILSTNPDLVLAEPSPGNRDAVMRLANLGIPVLVVPHGGLDEVRNAFVVVADSLGIPSRGHALLESFNESMEAVERAAAGQPTRRAALVFGRDPLTLAGPGSFGNELLLLAGGENIASDARVAYPTFPLELLVSRAPEVIIETTMTAKRGRPAPMRHLESTRHVVISGDSLLRPGPGLSVAARLVLEALHPNLDPSEAPYLAERAYESPKQTTHSFH